VVNFLQEHGPERFGHIRGQPALKEFLGQAA